MQCSVPDQFMTETFNFFFQTQLAAPELNKHLAVVIRTIEQRLVDVVFESFNIGNTDRFCHISLR